MPYAALDTSKPDPATQNVTAFAQSIRDNIMAVRDMIVMGCLPGWNFSTSGGTADQPAALYYSKSSERLRAALTWGTAGGAAGLVTVAVFAYSANGGAIYDTIGTETLTYDAAGNCTASAWS